MPNNPTRKKTTSLSTEEDLLTPPIADTIGQTDYRLALTNPKYFSPACGANPLRGWSLVLQGNHLGILYIYLLSALKTIRLQLNHPLFSIG